MKIFKLALAFCLGFCVAADVEAAGQRLTVGKGKSLPVDPGFKATKFLVEPQKGILEVSIPPGGGPARVTGLAEGTAALALFVPGGLKETYEVTVGGDLLATMRNLQTELEDVGGVDVTKVGESLIVKGEINDPEGWRLLKKTLAHPDFRSLVKDQTHFRVQADTLKDFRTQLKEAQFQITDKLEEAKAGKLYVKYEGNLLLINGVVYSPEEKEKLERIVAAQAAWLRVEDGKNVPSDESWKTTCRMNVSVDSAQMRMDVVLVGYKETDGSSYGSEAGLAGEALTFNGVFKGLVDLCKGKSQHDAFSVGADLNSTLKFLKKNEISRHTVGGHVFFKNNDPVERELKIGGTMKIKMKSATAEGVPTSNFEDIPYGFTIRKKSAVLLNAEQADVDLLITQKTPIPLEKGGYEEGYDVQETEYNPSIVCPIGKTVVLAGYKKMVESTMPPAGFPVLRHIPIMNWFVSQESDSLENVKLMMLVSVKIVRGDEPEAQNTRLAYEDTKDLPTEVEIPNRDRLESRKKWSGALYWLNWFTP